MNIIHNNQHHQDSTVEILVNPDGKSFFSVRYAANLLGVDEQSIRKSLKWFRDADSNGADFFDLESSQTVTAQGLEGADFFIAEVDDKPNSRLGLLLYEKGFRKGDFDMGIVDRAMRHIAHYYAVLANRTTTQANQFLEAIEEIGVRTWAHIQAGWSPNSNSDNEARFNRMETLLEQMIGHQAQLNQSLTEITQEKNQLKETVDEYVLFHHHLRNTVSSAEVLVHLPTLF